MRTESIAARGLRLRPTKTAWILAFLSMFSAACSSLPTARIDGSDYEPNRAERKLLELGDAVEESRLAHRDILHDPAAEQYLAAVVDRLLVAAERSAVPEFRVHLVRDPVADVELFPNASCILTSGVSAIAEDEAQLALLLGAGLEVFFGREFQRTIHGQEVIRTPRAIAAGLSLILFGPAAAAVMMHGSEDDVRIHELSRRLVLEREAAVVRRVATAGYDADHACAVLETILAGDAGESEAERRTSDLPTKRERIEGCRRAVAALPPDLLASATDRAQDAYDRELATIVLDNAESALAAGRPEHLERALERHVAIFPGSSRGWFLLAEARRNAGASRFIRLDGATEAYEHAIALDPSMALAYRELGLLRREQGRDREATTALRRYLELVPDAPDRAVLLEYASRG